MGGLALYNPYSTQPRQKPTTWQENQDQAAQDLWNAEQPVLSGDRAAAGAGRTAATTRTGSAFDRMMGYTPAASSGFKPSATEGYDPNGYYAGTGGRRASAALTSAAMTGGARGGGGGALDTFDASEGRKFSADDVSNFDPSAAGNTFAKGAWDATRANIGDLLDAETNKYAGSGRLRTGWFDKARGQVITRGIDSYNNALAQAALTFSGQRLDALKSGAGLRLSAAQGIDQAMLERARGIDANTLTREGMAFNDRKLLADTILAEEGMEFTGAGDRARLGLSRATSLDNFNAGRAHDIDTLTLQAQSTGLQAALDAERMARSDYNTSADRYGGYVSGTREWAGSDRQVQDERDYTAAERAYRRKYALNTGSTPADDPATAANKKLAARWGVPYVG